MQLEQFLEHSAERFPDKTALVSCGRRHTYGELERKCNSLAHSLLANGVERGDRVAVYLDNSVEAVIAVFAILKAGAVFLMVNPTTKSDKLAYILNNCRATALITDAAKVKLAEESLVETPHMRSIWITGDPPAIDVAGKQVIGLNAILETEDPLASQRPKKSCIDIDLAALIYTSGSTGRPKGVMLTHLNMVSAATSITTYLESRPDDVVLNVLPLSFDYGLYQVLMTFKVGGTLILERSFTYPYAVIDLLLREKVTGFPIVPTICAILLQMDLSKYDFPSLRYITNTAAALPAEHILRLRRLFPQVQIFSMYGLTECKRVSYLPPDQIDNRPTSVGRGMPNEEVYLVDDTGSRLANGMTGELVVRGSNVMKGYWELPEETSKMLKPGRLPGEMVLHTGDLFRSDEEGFLYFVGRKDDIIKSRGEKVSPREVEDILHSIPGIAEAAVIGVPDPVLGQAVKAFVRLREGVMLTEKDILRQVSQKMEDFMVPKYIEFRAEMPKSANGKVNKRELAATMDAVYASA